jgi:hypothetical protein
MDLVFCGVDQCALQPLGTVSVRVISSVSPSISVPM